MVSQDKDQIVMKPVPDIEDLAGVHSGKITLKEMRRDLDKMRLEDRY